MPCDYDKISEENGKRYGWDIGRVGKMLLSDRYDDRTHFIYELLQNAEDALARLTRPGIECSVAFDLCDDGLRFQHFGERFSEADVRGICGIAESTKGITAIGRFGIGFKSVYAFTKHPEIHSGDESFLIEDYVHPRAIKPIKIEIGETLVVMPFDLEDDADAYDEVKRGLRSIGPASLLFLKQIESIKWSENGHSVGQYLRQVKPLSEGVSRVDLVGNVDGEVEVYQSYLVFSKVAKNGTGEEVGAVEIAFRVTESEGRLTIVKIERSPLVVFFPTVVETNLGFFIQGPYRTTPSRDNVPGKDEWNVDLIQQTGNLLRTALTWLRDQSTLNSITLECLPIEREKFGEDSMFHQLFLNTKKALTEDELLPCENLSYLPATRVRLGRTKEIRSLLNPMQLQQIHGKAEPLDWIDGEITRDKAGQLRDYLVRELGVKEDTPMSIIRILDGTFLEKQPANWLCQLYEFLGDHLTTSRIFEELPLIRLQTGEQTKAKDGGRFLAYLPSDSLTAYPTVDPETIASEKAISFIKRLGLKEPDIVDDVFENVLPKYEEEEFEILPEQYVEDINLILHAFETDSSSQRKRLLSRLAKTNFVMANDATSGTKCRTNPSKVYFPTETISKLLAGVSGALLIDSGRYPCLSDDKVRDLLKSCGARLSLRPKLYSPNSVELYQLREKAKTTGTRSAENIEDYDLEHLHQILNYLPELTEDGRLEKASILWEMLCLFEREYPSYIYATYSGQYYGQKVHRYPAKFIERLKSTPWVPCANVPNTLKRPDLVLFEDTGFQHNPSLETIIGFKPPVIQQLADAAGIDPKMLDLLKEIGIKTENELRKRLRLPSQEEGRERNASSDLSNKGQKDSNQPEQAITLGGRKNPNDGPKPISASATVTTNNSGGSSSVPSSPPYAERKFISYIGLHPDHEPHLAGLTREERMDVEAQALIKIVAMEPNLKQTLPGNPGYDLFEESEDGEVIKWVEVKAMTGSLEEHPVAMSKTQMDFAREHGNAFWLYILERVKSGDANLVKIQDPYSLSMYYTFDRGWKKVGE